MLGMRETRYLSYDKIYSGNTRLKKSRKAGQKQPPQEISGDLFITGGVGTFDGIRYDKYRVFAGNFGILATSIFVHHASPLSLIIPLVQAHKLAIFCIVW